MFPVTVRLQPCTAPRGNELVVVMVVVVEVVVVVGGWREGKGGCVNLTHSVELVHIRDASSH